MGRSKSGIWPRQKPRKRPCATSFCRGPARSLRPLNSAIPAIPPILVSEYLTACGRCFHIENKIVRTQDGEGYGRAGSAASREDRAVAPNAAAGADTFPKLLVRNAQVFGTRPAMRHKDLGIWQTWTWAEGLDIVRAYAVGLHRLGLKRGETIAIVGANRPRLYWSVMAAQMLGAIPVPVYADAVAEELAYVLAHADVRLAAVEDQEQVDKILSVMERVPKLELMFYDEKRGLRDYDHGRLHSMEDVIEEGRKALASDPSVRAWLDREIAAGKGSDPSIILYTSGT